jgi:hypothetical protein
VSVSLSHEGGCIRLSEKVAVSVPRNLKESNFLNFLQKYNLQAKCYIFKNDPLANIQDRGIQNVQQQTDK